MPSRIQYIDNLRVFCILLVVFLHSAVTYSGMGMWYYHEPSAIDTGTKIFFAFFETHIQAFSMGLFFFIAGMFIPLSLDRKGRRKFILDRLYRLGIPAVLFILLLHPLSVVLAHPEVHFFDYVIHGIQQFEFFGWTGPLWFAVALFCFSSIYALIQPWMPACKNLRFTTPVLIGLIVCITLAAFCIRLVYPIGTAVMNMQFSFFASYIFMFSTGILAGRYPLIDGITLKAAKRWLAVSFGIGIPLWLSALVVGGAMNGRSDFNGGWNLAAFLFALWESTFCVAFIAALIGYAKEKMNSQGRAGALLSENTFGIYVFHTPVLIGLSVLVKDIEMHAFPKFLLVGGAAVICTLVVSWLIRRIPVAAKIFR